MHTRKEVNFRMTKKVFSLAIVTIFLLSTLGAYAAETASKSTDQPTIPTTESTKDRASRAMNNILYGPLETPKNIDQTNTKGTQIDRCIPKTKSGVERGIARVVGGIWQLATFWYSDPGCVTSSSQTHSTASTTK